MKVGVLSDTHCHALPQQMLEDFKKVDLILHAGDLCTVDVLEKLKKIKEIKAVHGNMDDSQIRRLLPRQLVVQCDGFKIGLFHGAGSPATILDVVKKEFEGLDVQAIVFGHSHQAMNEKVGDILFFNPGSPNDLVFASFCSYGILEIDKEITGKIIKVKF